MKIDLFSKCTYVRARVRGIASGTVLDRGHGRGRTSYFQFSCLPGTARFACVSAPIYLHGNVSRKSEVVDLAEREMLNDHKAVVLRFTRYSGSRGPTVAKTLKNKLIADSVRTMKLDGANIRHGLCGDVGFSDQDSAENIRYVGTVAKLFLDNGPIVVCTSVSPFRRDSSSMRGLLSKGRFIDVFVKRDLSVCRIRDPKGLCKRAEARETKEPASVDSP